MRSEEPSEHYLLQGEMIRGKTVHINDWMDAERNDLETEVHEDEMLEMLDSSSREAFRLFHAKI